MLDSTVVAQLARDALRRCQDAVEAPVIAVPLLPQRPRVVRQRHPRTREHVLEAWVARERIRIPVREPPASRFCVFDNGVDGEFEHVVGCRDVDAMDEIAEVVDPAAGHRPRLAQE